MPNALLDRSLRALLAAASLFVSVAQLQAKSPSDWFARDWQSEDGLPNNTVLAVAQTPDGYLWLGTRTGLVRFDGIHFEDLSSTNFVAPPNRGIVAMLPSREGGLWLAMDRGAIVRLNGAKTEAFVQGLSTRIPGGLAEAADGALWISYHGGTVYRIRQGRIVPCTARDGLPVGPDNCSLASDKKGQIWFCKSGQAGIVTNDTFQVLHQFEPTPSRLAAERDGGMWACIGTRLFKLSTEGAVEQRGTFEQNLANSVPNALMEDREGAVWVGTSFSGLFRCGKSGFERVETTHPEIQALAEDREGNIWVGTSGGGLNRIRQRAVVLEGPENGLPFPSVISLCEDDHGSVWAATQNGSLARRQNDQWSSLRIGAGSPIQATCIASGPKGAIWLGTILHGLYAWRSGNFESVDRPALNNQTVHCLLASRGGDLWVALETPPRLVRLRDGNTRVFDAPPDSRIIRAITEDPAGNIWAGTSKGNLFRISGDTLTEINHRDGRDKAPIRCLYCTPDGALWLGYAGWGVGRLKDGVYAEFHTENGLYDDQISAIIADGRGWMWFSSDKGLFKIRQQDLEDVARVVAGRVRSIHYGRSEGLPSLEANFGDAPNVLRSYDGRLWFPMRTALAIVDLEKLRESDIPPNTLIEQVSLDEKQVAAYSGIIPLRQGESLPSTPSGTRLRFQPGYRRLTVQFTALNFSAPENIQFRYRLEGLDDDWNEAADRNVTYPRLPPGNYTLHITATDTEGNWDTGGTTLALTVVPFFWQTWWFRTGLLALFGLSVGAFVRYVYLRRFHQQLRILEHQTALHKERARIAKDIHDDLGANLTQIALLGELAQQDRSEPERASERMTKISATARQAIKSLDEIVWAVNPRNDTLAHLIDYAGQFALDYLRVADIRCRLDLPEHPPSREVSTDLRHNLFLVLKEALNNVVRHAQATEVFLRARADEKELLFTIEDNGRGFAAMPKDAFADGLRNMQQRMADIGGNCTIDSRLGQGTSIRLLLPWPST